MDGGVRLPEEILEALARGATILSGNQRAARTLQHGYDLQQRALEQRTWTSPRILSWDGWIATQWQQLLLHGRTTRLLLNRTQEHTLWCEIIAADPEFNGLRSADALAEMAADAWSRLCAYRGEQRLRNAGTSADTRAFQRWAAAFERRCRSGNFLSPAQLEATVSLELAAHRLALPEAGFVLIGFDGKTPAREAVLQAIRSSGTAAVELALSLPAGQRNLVAANDQQEELVTAARWIRSYLEGHTGDRVALIVPGLEGRRAALDRVLREVLAPELQDISANSADAPFEYSLGVALGTAPLIATALDLLRWATGSLPIKRISALLLSPHFGDRCESNVRAAYDAYELRRTPLLQPELSLTEMIRGVERSRTRSQKLLQLLATLKALNGAAKAEALSTESRSAAEWAEVIHTLLDAARWAEGADSTEFQVRRKWESLLDELATLDFEGGRIRFDEALQTVDRLAQQTLFAPESRNAPVQVMGPLESAGSTFDALWFLGAGDLAWPVRSGTNPLLSWNLQRELGMPGSDIQMDSDYARRMTERIAGSASTVFFSFPKETADGRQRPSNLLSGLNLSHVAVDDLLPPQSARETVVLEDADDDLTLSPLPDRIVRGGADLLKQQAACGFRAFAEKRLWATGLDSKEAGMDARERGNAVHLALQTAWRELGTQDQLKAMPEGERRALLARSIDEALTKMDAVGSSAWDAAYMGVQRERLLDLLDPWLLAEMRREVPFLVKVSELELHDVRVGPLRLTLRVDRVDETEFGDVILDYKTGAASPNAWLSDRPDEPQLPLYAILSQAENLAGVAFAQVRAGKDMDLAGYQTQDGILLRATKLKEAATLEAQVEEWRTILTGLAEDFSRGDVRVRPKKYPNTCEYCAQRLLCRLDISLLDQGSDPDAENEADLG
jgi:ATP-dependent helicase/nuclease subunit B